MLLAIDVGNTETKVGCFRDDGTLAHPWRVTTESRRTADEYAVFIMQLFSESGLAKHDIGDIVIASVVPRVDAALADMSLRFFGRRARFLQPETQSCIRVRTQTPSESGADLVAVAIGARERFGAPLIAVSYGTATAFIAIDAEGDYVGVAIAPGINTSIDALIGRAAKLPQIALEAPSRAIGRNTVEALQSGIVYGFVGQTEAIVSRMRHELGVQANVVATGGLAEVIAKQCALIASVDPYLSLFGLAAFAATHA